MSYGNVGVREGSESVFSILYYLWMWEREVCWVFLVWQIGDSFPIFTLAVLQCLFSHFDGKLVFWWHSVYQHSVFHPKKLSDLCFITPLPVPSSPLAPVFLQFVLLCVVSAFAGGRLNSNPGGQLTWVFVYSVAHSLPNTAAGLPLNQQVMRWKEASTLSLSLFLTVTIYLRSASLAATVFRGVNSLCSLIAFVGN